MGVLRRLGDRKLERPFLQQVACVYVHTQGHATIHGEHERATATERDRERERERDTQQCDRRLCLCMQFVCVCVSET